MRSDLLYQGLGQLNQIGSNWIERRITQRRGRPGWAVLSHRAGLLEFGTSTTERMSLGGRVWYMGLRAAPVAPGRRACGRSLQSQARQDEFLCGACGLRWPPS